MVEWLNRYEQLNQEIAELDMDMIRAQIEFERWKHGDLSNTQSYEITLGKQQEMAEIIEKKDDAMHQLIKQRKYIEKTVERFKGIHNMIARERYIEGKSIVEIAEEYNYSEQYVYNKHAEIKRMIEFAQT